MHTGKSLTVKNNNIIEGTEIVQYDYQGLASQKWIIRDTGKGGWVLSPLTNRQLAITIQGIVENGSKLILTNIKENYNQLFCLYDISARGRTKENGIYKISSSKDINKSIEVPGGNKENNAQVGLWDYRKWNASKTLL